MTRSLNIVGAALGFGAISVAIGAPLLDYWWGLILGSVGLGLVLLNGAFIEDETEFSLGQSAVCSLILALGLGLSIVQAANYSDKLEESRTAVEEIAPK